MGHGREHVGLPIPSTPIRQRPIRPQDSRTTYRERLEEVTGEPRKAAKPVLVALAGLLVVSSVVQACVIWRSTTTSFDAVWFVNLAREMDQVGVLAAMTVQREQPLFPVWLWIVHEIVQHAVGVCRWEWALSAQLAAATALVLAVVPVYFVSVRLVGKVAGLAAALLFCLLPEVCRLGADGISDSSHLLLFSLALWAILEYLTRLECPPCSQDSTSRLGPSILLLGAGLATAAAVLTRAEAMVLPLALTVTLAVFQVGRSRRQPVMRVLAHLGCFAFGFAVIFIPYLAAVGSLEPKDALARAMGRYQSPAHSPAADPAIGGPAWELADGCPMSFAVKEPTSTIRQRGYGRAITELFEELAQLFGPLAGPLALLGLFRLRGRRPSAADRFAHILLLLFTFLLLRHAAHEGYLSTRHLLVWMVVGIGCAGYGALELARLLAGLFRSAGLGSWAPPAAIGSVTLAVIGTWSLWLAEPLHASRLGHRRAAEWLATVAAAPGAVFDTHGWTGLYSGRRTYGPDELRKALGDPRLAYLVLEPQELEFASDRSRTLRWLIETAAEPAVKFSHSEQWQAHPAVAVYRWYPQNFSRWQRLRMARLETAAAQARRNLPVTPPDYGKTNEHTAGK